MPRYKKPNISATVNNLISSAKEPAKALGGVLGGIVEYSKGGDAHKIQEGYKKGQDLAEQYTSFQLTPTTFNGRRI
jgi:hypothetical protein